jgi:hypothetical protein
MVAKPLVADDIAFVRSMLATINLDDKAPLATDEIRDVRSDRFLAHKFVAVNGAGAQTIPQFRLGVGRVSTQKTGTGSF